MLATTRTVTAVDATASALESNAPDGLWRTTWVFVALDGRLVVDMYERWRRPSARSKPKIEERRHCMSPAESTVTKAEVPFTPCAETWARAE